MLKKILKFLKFVFVLFFWSIAWLSVMRAVMRYVWNFDLISAVSWQTIYVYWNKGGIIRSGYDYMLFITIIFVFVVWYVGLKRIYKIDFMRLLLKPFEYFSKKEIEKLQGESKHIALKNLVVGEKITLDDLIEEKIKEEGSSQSQKESQNLRENISKKIIERKGQ